VNVRARKKWRRLALMWGWLLAAFLVGEATHSVGAFVAVCGAGLVADLVLRFTVWR
jgi:hypothetical protein